MTGTILCNVRRRELRATMMNPRGPHHKILMMSGIAFAGSSPSNERPIRHRDGGYALVALMAMMTVLGLFAMAAAPTIRRQAQRENEIEAIYRGEQVADAIRAQIGYNLSRSRSGDDALPRSIDDLLEGIPVGTRKIQIL